MAQADERPNIVLIVADDLGYGELGCQGNPQIPTPRIDALAAAGVRMTAGYVTSSYCSPSRAGLVTGRYQTRFGHEFNPTGAFNLEPLAGLPLTEDTLADALGRAGYTTGLVGKWHLGGTPAYHPQRRGFDEFFGFLHEGHFYVPGPPWEGVQSFLRRRDAPGRVVEGNVIWSPHGPMNEPPYDAHNPILRGTREVQEPTYLTDAFTREAVAFIDRHRDERFFLMLSHLAVHSPMQAPLETLDKFESIDDMHRRVFAGMLAHLDDSVGAVLDKLDEHGLTDNTLVVFLSDNGGPTQELTSSNDPLRGGKGNFYEGGLRVPMLVAWPGVLPKNTTYEAPVVSVDLTATMLAAGGATSRQPLDGVDLRPYLTGEQETRPRETVFWRMGRNAALRQGDWKLVRDPRAEGEPWKLFDLAQDLGEQHDLAETHPDLLDELRETWNALDAEMAPPIWQRPRR